MKHFIIICTINVTVHNSSHYQTSCFAIAPSNFFQFGRCKNTHLHYIYLIFDDHTFSEENKSKSGIQFSGAKATFDKRAAKRGLTYVGS